MSKREIVKAEVVELAARLTKDERAELRRQEKRVEDAVASFIEIGEGLQAIRDGRLYRETHDTFDDYLADRWGFTRQRAAQVIAAAETMAELPATVRPVIDNERKARAIRPVADKPAKAKAAVKEAAKASDGNPTAADIERAVDKVSGGGRGVPAAAAPPDPSGIVEDWIAHTEALPLPSMTVEDRRRVRAIAAGLASTIDGLNGETQRARQKAAAQKRGKTRPDQVVTRFKGKS